VTFFHPAGRDSRPLALSRRKKKRPVPCKSQKSTCLYNGLPGGLLRAVRAGNATPPSLLLFVFFCLAVSSINAGRLPPLLSRSTHSFSLLGKKLAFSVCLWKENPARQEGKLTRKDTEVERQLVSQANQVDKKKALDPLLFRQLPLSSREGKEKSCQTDRESESFFPSLRTGAEGAKRNWRLRRWMEKAAKGNGFTHSLRQLRTFWSLPLFPFFHVLHGLIDLINQRGCRVRISASSKGNKRKAPPLIFVFDASFTFA